MTTEVYGAGIKKKQHRELGQLNVYLFLFTVALGSRSPSKNRTSFLVPIDVGLR